MLVIFPCCMQVPRLDLALLRKHQDSKSDCPPWLWGRAADANILINRCRLAAQQYRFQYQEPIPVEQLVRAVCDSKQGYTQFGGLRPFGVSLLYAGWCAAVLPWRGACPDMFSGRPAYFRHISVLLN